MKRSRWWLGAALALVVSCGSGGEGGGARDGTGGEASPAADAGREGTPGDPAGPGACEAGRRKCEGEQEAYLCDEGAWRLVQVCGADQICAEGRCALRADCQPGQAGDCWSQTAATACSPTGTSFVPVDCAEGEFCLGGACTAAECFPGSGSCVDGVTLKRCGEDGTWLAPEACPDGLICAGDRCVTECQMNVKWANSSIGCEYWTVDLDQATFSTPLSGDPTPASVPHSVVLSNPNDTAATVSFKTLAAGITLPWSQEVLQAGETREFEMPVMDLEGAGIFDRSVRILSNRPLVAVQFNPKDMVDAHSNDSSLLLPAEMLGTDYLVLAWPSDMPTPYLGYFTVIAVEPGETSVTVTPASEGEPVVPDGQKLAKGVPTTIKLQQFQVLQVEGRSKTISFENDMSGSRVKADRRVAVFAGHEGPVICPEASRKALCPATFPDPDNPPRECDCCHDHLEEQLWPVNAWSSTYLVPKAARRGAVDADTYRVQAGVDGVSLHTEPAIAGLDGRTLAKAGDWLQASTDQSFRLVASGPVQIAQYLSNMQCTSDDTGDPSMTMIAGVSQYRDDYPILVPQGYDDDWVAVVRPIGSTTTLDGQPTAAAFDALASTGYEVGYVAVTAGPHRVEGSAPFGAIQYGFFEATCYANPAGMNLVPWSP